MSLSYTFYLEKPVELPTAGLSTGASGSVCAATTLPYDIGWPKPAVSMVLHGICGGGSWVKVDFGWLGAEVATLALATFVGYRLVRKAKPKSLAQ